METETNPKEWLCPRCFNYSTGYPALSRRDNATSICSECGTQEALDDYFRSRVSS